jgi:hypothetical protein
MSARSRLARRAYTGSHNGQLFLPEKPDEANLCHIQFVCCPRGHGDIRRHRTRRRSSDADPE